VRLPSGARRLVEVAVQRRSERAATDSQEACLKVRVSGTDGLRCAGSGVAPADTSAEVLTHHGEVELTSLTDAELDREQRRYTISWYSCQVEELDVPGSCIVVGEGHSVQLASSGLDDSRCRGQRLDVRACPGHIGLGDV